MATKVGNFLRKITSAFVARNATSQAAMAAKFNPKPVLKATVGQGLTAKQTVTANKVLGAANTSYGGLTYNNKSANTVQNTNFNNSKNNTISPADIQRAISSGALTVNSVGSGGFNTTDRYIAPAGMPGYGGNKRKVLNPDYIDPATAPTDASKINNVGTFNLDGVGSGSTSPMGAGAAGVANATGAVAGLETSVDQKIADAQKAEEQRIVDESTKKTTLFDKLLGNEKTPSEVGAETKANLEEEYGIKSQISEINSLTDSLNKVEVEKQAQVAQAQDKLGTNNFINNQVQQIDRNSRPIIDRLKADINFKTGILTQNRELIAEAVTQATAQSRDKWERLKYTYEENKDLIDSLGKVHADSYKRTIDRAYAEHERELKLHDWKVEMRLKYGANIGINDSEATILDKISRVGGRTISDRSSGGSKGGTLEERQANSIAGISSKIVPGAMTPSGLTILNPDGGYINPEAWKDMIKHAPEIGLTRSAFISNFGNYLFLDKKGKPSSNYGLTPKELKDLGYE